ncbi:MAG: hypothetical protein PVH45_01000 [Candidatus Omnitrophota bacterium]|jgi:mannose-6-phosphate isomerase class I
MNKVLEAVRNGNPLYVIPYKEHKVWGVGGIGEYWYGAETGGKSSLAKAGDETVPLVDIVSFAPEDFLGKEVVARFGMKLPLVKILTPKGRLSVQFHDKKNELWVVTGIDEASARGEAKIVLGFHINAIRNYGANVGWRYKEALEKYGSALNALIDLMEYKGHKDLLKEKGNVISAAREIDDAEVQKYLKDLNSSGYELESFYNYRPVKIGDVIPISSGTLHALGPGVEVVEPQIPGPTQSMEDGATYPVRYYFPGYERGGVKKELDIFRAGEINADVPREEEPETIHRTDSATIERLPGRFESKGLEVHRITIVPLGGELKVTESRSFHNFVAVSGQAALYAGEKRFEMPKAIAGGEMMILPATSSDFKIVAEEPGTQVIDTFSPTG